MIHLQISVLFTVNKSPTSNVCRLFNCEKQSVCWHRGIRDNRLIRQINHGHGRLIIMEIDVGRLIIMEIDVVLECHSKI